MDPREAARLKPGDRVLYEEHPKVIESGQPHLGLHGRMATVAHVLPFSDFTWVYLDFDGGPKNEPCRNMNLKPLPAGV